MNNSEKLDTITLANGNIVSWEEFSSWSAAKQSSQLKPPNLGRKFGIEHGIKAREGRKRALAKGAQYKKRINFKPKNCSRVRTPLGEFSSLREAGQFYNVLPATIRDRIKKGCEGYESLTPPVKYVIKADVIRHTRKVRSPLGEFDSMKQAAAAHNVHTNVIRNRIKAKIEGYEFLTEQFANVKKIKSDDTSMPTLKIKTPLGIFNSMAEAAEVHNLTSNGLRHRMKKQLSGYEYLITSKK